MKTIIVYSCKEREDAPKKKPNRSSNAELFRIFLIFIIATKILERLPLSPDMSAAISDAVNIANLIMIFLAFFSKKEKR